MDQYSAKGIPMTQIRREVSLDSQGPMTAGGASLANSRLTLESLRGETPLSVKSSFDLVDESVQVDLSADTITYDSDDEMVKKRISLILSRNKKGHPVYSREDIREQYCINRKEVEVLESARSIKFLGCFSQQKSPCSKNSILLSCIQKIQRSNSEETVCDQDKRFKEEATLEFENVTPTPYDDDRTFDDDRKSTDRSIDFDEDYEQSGFRKRPRTICQYDPNRSRSSWMEAESIDYADKKRKLESSASLGSTSQQSYDEIEKDYVRSYNRPSQLVIASRGRYEYFQPSRSVDELNDTATTRRTAIVVPPRIAKTPDISLEDRRPKHVSFDNGSLIRSNTIGGGLEDVATVSSQYDPGPVATSTPLNIHQRRTFSPPLTIAPQRNRSKERLLDSSSRQFSDLSDDRILSVTSSTMTNITLKPDQNLSYQMHHRRRTKTQATQTELTFKERFMLPAYLTLSPRAHKTTAATQAFMPNHLPPMHRTRNAPRSRSSTKISKSRSAYEALGSGDDTEDDVMEVDLSGKHHRLLRTSASRTSIRRQKAFDSSQEEIMVSFKPVASPPLPKQQIEVLLGDRPVPRSTNRDRKKDISKTVEPMIDTKPAPPPKPLKALSSSSQKRIEKLHAELKIEQLSKELNDAACSAVSKKVEAVHSKREFIPLPPEINGDKPTPEDVSEVSGMRSPSGHLIGFKSAQDTLGSSSAKSSSESTKFAPQRSLKKQPTMHRETIQPKLEISSSIEEKTHRSEDSGTATTDGSQSPEALKAQELYEEKKRHYMTKYHQHVKESSHKSPTSPDSESSSSIFTERETSRSEVSTSSSNNEVVNKSDSESSEYVTAPDHSHRENSTPRKRTPDDTTTTFESFSSPSSRSSLHLPPQQRQQKSLTSPSSSPSLLPLDDDRTDHEEKSSLRKKVDYDSVLSPPPLPPLPPDIEDHLESSDESTKKETSSGTDEGDVPDWRLRIPVDDASGTPDSDRTSDITPVFDASPEPLSSLHDDAVETVIEVRNSATSDDANSFSPALVCSSSSTNGEERHSHHGARTESESSESSCVLSGIQDLESASKVGSGMDSCGNQQFSDHKESDDLSTVSEVSEESSKGSFKKKQAQMKSSDVSSPSDNLLSPDMGKKSSSSEYIPSEATTSSFDSTTSGSFLLENGSCSTSSSNNNVKNNNVSNKSSSDCSSKRYGTTRREEEKEEEEEEEEDDDDDDDESDSSKKSFDTGSESLITAEITEISNDKLPKTSYRSDETNPSQKSEEKRGKQEQPVVPQDVIKDTPSSARSQKTSSPSSATSEQSEKLATASSTTPFSSSSSSLLHEYRIEDRSYRVSQDRPSRSRSVEEPQHSLSAWCSEGAIPKQRYYEVSDTRRRRERLRMRSESREHPPSLQLLPPDYHHHHHYPRSKSHSPEKSEEEELDLTSLGIHMVKGHSSKRFLCAQCGDKIREPGAPHSAPPPGMWERPFQRSFWEPPSSASHHHQHHHHQHLQNVSWRQPKRGTERSGDARFKGYGGGPLPRSWSSECGPVAEPELYPDEDEDAGIHSESYRGTTWIYISESDELAVWKQPVEKPERSEVEEADPSCTLPSSSISSARRPPPLTRTDSAESTSSEHEFLRQYQAVTHRMVHRKSSVEMYNRMDCGSFEVDKRVVVQRNNGEFGFRIHGSKPVVVSAIERGTPAETCGLEVGDIIVCINGLNVLDASHSEVVRIAHTGTEVLMMEVIRTSQQLVPKLMQSPSMPVFSGFLQRLSARSLNRRRWCRRWFAVREEGVLYWFRTVKDHEPLGALVLQNQSISRVPEAGSPHAFKVSRFGSCPHYFSADDEDTATMWISALNQVATNASRSDSYMERSVRNAQLPLASMSHPDCQGFLGKLSQRWKSWKRRYFFLKDAALYFYVDHSAKVALGLFHLHGYKVQSCSLQGKKNTFEAIPPEPRLKHLYFQADSENEKKRWLAALEYSIDRWIKIG